MKELQAILNFLDKKSLIKINVTLFEIIKDLESENFHFKKKAENCESESEEKYRAERMRADANEIRAESLEILLKKLIDKILKLKGEPADEENNFEEFKADELQGCKKCTD